MKGGRLLGGYEGKPSKGGYFLGQTGGVIRRKHSNVKIRTTIPHAHRVVKSRTQPITSAIKQQPSSSTFRALKPITSKRRVVRRRIKNRVKQRVRRPSKKTASTARKSVNAKQVKETVKDIVSHKLDNLGKRIKQKAAHKLTDLGKKVGEDAVYAIARRGKRVLEDISENNSGNNSEPVLPQVKRRRLNAASKKISTKKGYLSGFKQYGGSRLF